MAPKKNNKPSVFVAPAKPNNTNSTHKFQKGDTVWCKWYSKYYRATISKLTVQINGEQYYGVHYWKFAKNWDMTVNEKRLLPWTKESRKFVQSLHRDLSRLKKQKKVEAQLIADIQKNIRENPLQQQRPFLVLSDIKPLLKGYVAGENHHSAEESVQLSTSRLTFVIRESCYELKNLSTKSPASKNLCQENGIESSIIDKDSETPKTGLLKAFSPREKDVINVLDNMRSKTMRLRSRSSPKSNQEGSDILNNKKLSMPSQTTNCIITIVSNPDTNVDGGKRALDENDHFTEEFAISKPEEHAMYLDNSTDCSVSKKSKTCCKVNNILSILNDGPCHISSISVITAISRQHEKNLNDNENINFDINGNTIILILNYSGGIASFYKYIYIGR